MNIKLLIMCLCLFCMNQAWGQSREQYDAYVQQASALYDAKQYQQSAEAYQLAFEQLGGKAVSTDRYNAACSHALAEDAENAFYHLFYLAEHPKVQYRNLGHISTDTDLTLLHEDSRWDSLIAIVKANKEEYEKDLDVPLMARLDSIYQLDQGYRRQIGEIEESYGRDSEEMRAHWRLIMEADSINLIKVKEILDERGWLSPKVIGGQGNQTLFLVIQHADLASQIHYLPMMRDAVNKGNASPSSLALLEDRVALRQGERQIYGSQIGMDPETGEHYVLPLIEPEKVNERRAKVGLPPIETYVSNWEIVWDVEAHKKKVEQMESRQD